MRCDLEAPLFSSTLGFVIIIAVVDIRRNLIKIFFRASRSANFAML